MIIWRAQSTQLLWRLPCLVCVRSEGASTVRKGKAQGRVAHGNGTNSIMQTQRRPKQVTRCFSLERTASRNTPLALILAPRRRSSVSSITTTIGAFALNSSATNNLNRMRLNAKHDQVARLKTHPV